MSTTPPTSSTKLLNFVERVAWTLLQVASAEGLLLAWEQVRGMITDNRGLILVVVTTVLAAIKNAAAQAFGSPTGSTLPGAVAPVLAEEVVARTEGDSIVAATGSPLDNGTPVLVTAGGDGA